MQTPKEATRELLEILPDDVSMETIMAELYVKAKVLRGIEQAERGEVVTQEEAKKRLSRWLA
ncbi:MAG TPA: hypothetical protein VJP07_04935 [Dehalococcoidia bacterium]|nr:hypothetical protein [Dehalococcoidia bacterium]